MNETEICIRRERKLAFLNWFNQLVNNYVVETQNNIKQLNGQFPISGAILIYPLEFNIDGCTFPVYLYNNSQHQKFIIEIKVDDSNYELYINIKYPTELTDFVTRVKMAIESQYRILMSVVSEKIDIPQPIKATSLAVHQKLEPKNDVTEAIIEKPETLNYVIDKINVVRQKDKSKPLDTTRTQEIRVPKYMASKARWVAIYKRVKGFWKNQSKTLDELVAWLSTNNDNLSVSKDTLRDILKAGDSGLLDE